MAQLATQITAIAGQTTFNKQALLDGTYTDAYADNLALVLSFLVLYVTANFASHYVFGALGVHNRLSRASGTAGIAFTFSSILWGVQPLLRDLLLLVLVADLAQRYGAVAGELWKRRARRA